LYGFAIEKPSLFDTLIFSGLYKKIIPGKWLQKSPILTENINHIIEGYVLNIFSIQSKFPSNVHSSYITAEKSHVCWSYQRFGAKMHHHNIWYRPLMDKVWNNYGSPWFLELEYY